MSNTNSVSTTKPLKIWKHYHWCFFTLIQGLALALLRFESAIAENNLEKASFSLKAAAALMTGSGAAMNLAGSFKRSEYEMNVRPTMTPPHVQSKDFSGLASLDHVFLVSILMRLKQLFKELPPTLTEPHEQFMQAYESLMNSHIAVCEKFGGKEIPSLRSPGGTALTNLEKLSRGRSRLINPNSSNMSGCPFHKP